MPGKDLEGVFFLGQNDAELYWLTVDMLEDMTNGMAISVEMRA